MADVAVAVAEGEPAGSPLRAAAMAEAELAGSPLLAAGQVSPVELLASPMILSSSDVIKCSLMKEVAALWDFVNNNTHNMWLHTSPGVQYLQLVH